MYKNFSRDQSPIQHRFPADKAFSGGRVKIQQRNGKLPKIKAMKCEQIILQLEVIKIDSINEEDSWRYYFPFEFSKMKI